VRGEESEAEGEGRGREDGESLSKDVGHRLGLEEVRVELVAVQTEQYTSLAKMSWNPATGRGWYAGNAVMGRQGSFQIELIYALHFPLIHKECQVIGNVVMV